MRQSTVSMAKADGRTRANHLAALGEVHPLVAACAVPGVEAARHGFERRRCARACRDGNLNRRAKSAVGRGVLMGNALTSNKLGIETFLPLKLCVCFYLAC
jgi:hypothetical protein